MWIKWLMLVLFFALMVGIGFWCRKKALDVNGFVLGGRNVGPWLTAFAYGTSYFSAVIFVGYAGQFGWRFGIASTWIGIGNALIGSLLPWFIIGRRTRIMTKHLGSSTMPDFFEKRYGSSALKVFASAIVFVFLIPYTASLYNGLSRLFEMAFGIDYTYCILAMAVLTGIYVIAGGYMATAVNDFVQGIIMLAGITAVVAAVLNQNGGLSEALSKLSLVADKSGETGKFTSILGAEPLNLLYVIVLTSLGTWGLPQMVQKFYAIKSDKAIVRGAVISTVFAFIIAGGCYFLGGFGRLYEADLSASGSVLYDSIIPKILSNLSPFLIGIVILLVLSASMSTLSSLVLASSSTMTLDFIKQCIDRKMNEKKQMLVMRLLIVIFIAISAAIAILQYKATAGIAFIAQLMGVSWGALAGSFLAPFLYGLYWKRTSRAAVWVSFIFGAGLMMLNSLYRAAFPLWLQSPINCGAFTMVFSLVLVPVVSLLTPAPDKAFVSQVFSCYKKPKIQ